MEVAKTLPHGMGDIRVYVDGSAWVTDDDGNDWIMLGGKNWLTRTDADLIAAVAEAVDEHGGYAHAEDQHACEIAAAVKNARGMVLLHDEGLRVTEVSDARHYRETFAGPFQIDGTDLKLMVKRVDLDGSGMRLDFVVIDCEGDILDHDAYGLEGLDFSTLTVKADDPSLIVGHAPTCAVTRQRVSLLAEIAEATRAYIVPGDLLGAAVEYFGGGDQESEGCDCGAIA